MSCSTHTGTDPVWTRTGPAKCSQSRTCGAISVGPTTPRASPRTASVPLPFQGATIGPLNTYARPPQAFSRPDVDLVEEVTASVAVGNAEAAARTSDDLTQLRIVMMSRSYIEQAEGILMERHKTTEDEAFTMLTYASQRTNTKLRDVAAELVRTGARATQSRLTTIQRIPSNG
jgi:ANTAR domain